MKLKRQLLATPISLLALAGAACVDPTTADTGDAFSTDGWPLGTVVDVEAPGLLAELDTVQGPLQILRVQGTHLEMGRQMGALVGSQVEELWDGFVSALGADLGMDREAVEQVYMPVLQTVYDGMTPYMPDDQRDLVEGMRQGMGQGEGDSCHVCLVVALSNLSDLNFSDIPAAFSTVNNGMSSQLEAWYAEGPDAAAALPPPPDSTVLAPFHTCSFFAAWGSRTEDGHMLASRNLDWNADTGISKHRLITIFVPEGPGAGHPFATIGYAGMVGALAGISSAGIAVAEVGSTGVLERLTGQPWVMRHMEILEHAEDLDDALLWHQNQVPDGFNRPPTIGYNFMVAWGDPDGDGDSAEAAVVEANGAMVSVFRRGDGGTAEVHLFAEDGTHQEAFTEGHDLVNAERDAVEVDAQGEPRTFAVDEDGAFILDESGRYVEDPDGEVMPTGRPLAEALYRGDEALSHLNRRFQRASSGPQSSDGVLVQSGSYRHRYLPSQGMLQAWEEGAAYEEDGAVIVPDGGGRQTSLGWEEAVGLTSHVAMSSNILSVVYDATSLQIMFSYETGTGDDWLAASEREYAVVDLSAAMAW